MAENEQVNHTVEHSTHYDDSLAKTKIKVNALTQGNDQSNLQLSLCVNPEN